MLTLEEQLHVVNLYEELGSYRAVAEVVGCDHRTVKATLERVGRPKRKYPRRGLITDAYRVWGTESRSSSSSNLAGTA